MLEYACVPWYVGADVRKDDGIYSRYFLDYNANGAYSIRVEVVGVDGKVMLNKRKRSYAQGAPPMPQYRGQSWLTLFYIFE